MTMVVDMFTNLMTFESTPGDISTRFDYAERFGFDPDGQIQNEFFDKIVPYPWKVAV